MIKCIDNAVNEDDLISVLQPTHLDKLRNGKHGEWNHCGFPFYIEKDVVASSNVRGVKFLKNSKQSTQFVHSLILQHRARGGKFFNSNYTEPFFKMMKNMVEKHLPEYKHYEFDRMKINLLLKNNTPEVFNVPHIDELKKHISIVLYLNDSDGETVFFKEREMDRHNKEFTEVARIKPKFGRAVVSDGHFHCASNPYESDFRIILNTVLIEFNK
tara:strand:+ start:397 stop:1038 length:642 start_codon:yes stop_codon:yes gene_type:complete